MFPMSIDGVDTGVRTDASNWNIPIAVVVIIVIMFVVLVTLLGLFIHLYCRLRHERSSRVVAAVSREPEDPTGEVIDRLTNDVYVQET